MSIQMPSTASHQTQNTSQCLKCNEFLQTLWVISSSSYRFSQFQIHLDYSHSSMVSYTSLQSLRRGCEHIHLLVYSPKYTQPGLDRSKPGDSFKSLTWVAGTESFEPSPVTPHERSSLKGSESGVG